MKKRFFSIKEVTKFLGISRPTLYRLLKSGMPNYRLGKRRIFDPEELVSWIKSDRNNKPKKSAKGKPKKKEAGSSAKGRKK